MRDSFGCEFDDLKFGFEITVHRRHICHGYLLARTRAARRHEEEEEFDNVVLIRDDLNLIPNDGYHFVVERRTAVISQTHRNMLCSAGTFEEVQTKIIRLPTRAIIIELIIEY
jgi:hypothetical protein